MDFSAFENISSAIEAKFGSESILDKKSEAIQPYIVIDKNSLVKICEFLYTDERFYFDLLNCITAIDNGPENNSMELWYHLTSIPFEKSFIIRVIIDRTPKENEELPSVPSLNSIWKTANWHEREAFDLLGINFSDHPDLRRILLPADWLGYPLRQDYQEMETYHGIKVKY
ncbi:NADH-quinone oxidoreductase subunit C [uncultured Arcticibacterium sp.]|uniref:NADH-quinone oxidoreductase subunit C n=1 Tax=uncultured Arcticibacterium sp. TaxID=2173042 RepID=UPI0030F91F5E